VAENAHETATSFFPVASAVLMGAGQATTGGSLSTTVTEKEQETEFKATSRAIHVTVVVPRGNTESAGVHVTVVEL
jgi:hypothetical protein